MSPLFGHGDGDQDQTDRNALQAEVDRLDSLPLPELAAEVMAKGFGPGGQGADKDSTVTVGGPDIDAGVTVGSTAADFGGADPQRGKRIIAGDRPDAAMGASGTSGTSS